MMSFQNLSQSRANVWLQVDDVTPKHGHRVLLHGRNGDAEVGQLDASIGMWIVRGQPVPFDNFTHWQFLPESPIDRR